MRHRQPASIVASALVRHSPAAAGRLYGHVDAVNGRACDGAARFDRDARFTRDQRGKFLDAYVAAFIAVHEAKKPWRTP